MKRIAFGAPLALLACTGCAHHPQTVPEQSAPVAARVISVAPAKLPEELALTGIVTARQVADITSQVMAPIREMRVREGDTVSKGQVLVRLSSAPLAAGVEQAQSQVAAARKQEAAAEAQKNLAAATFARYDQLNQRHSVTPNEFDQVKTQLASAEAQQQSAAAQVQAAQAAAQQAQATDAYTTITAPFSGIVTGKYADPGSMAAPGTPLLRIEDARRHEVDVQVNESALRDVRRGELVKVQVEGTNRPADARIREVVPAGDPAAHTFTVKVALPASSGIYSGMTAHVLIPVGEHTALSIPRSAVRQRGQLDSVLALDADSVAQIRYVNLGRAFDGTVEVTSGLNAGDRILAQPNDALIGRRIEPQS
jgi:RND family efflux transporter MFP subunit